MATLFARADAHTTKKTLAIYRQELARDKKKVAAYSFLIPINRVLYIVILPLIFSLVVQSLIQQPSNWQYPVLLLVVATVVAAVSIMFSRIGFTLLFKHTEVIQTRLVERAVTHLMKHSDQFFANKKVGSIAGDVHSFGSSVVHFLDIIFLNASGIVMNFVASLIVIAVISPILLLPLGFVTVFLVMHSIRSISRRGPLRTERKKRTSLLSGTIADILSNQQIVRFFAMGDKEVRRVLTERRKIQDIANAEIDIIEHEAFVRQSVLFGFQIITILMCVWLFSSSLISIAALIFTVTYLGRLTNSLFEITPIVRNLEQALLDAAHITDILDETAEVTDVHQAKKLVVNGGGITFKDVNFSYKDNNEDSVIKDLSLTIKPGERIGLAGHSGGGKTTLSKLLLRFADVQDGVIMIDGQDISQVTQHSLHESIAYVPQEAYLFHRSLRDNIAYGRPNATDNQIMKALKQANALDFIEKLPGGLDTIIGERGIKLSGGQRQRIAIARAILKDAPILVLDEATSALDSASEMLIQESLSRLMKNRTSVVIAHRLSTIAQLDRILVLDNGVIVEQGSHAELLEQQGIYAKLWSHQSGGFIQD